MREISEEFWGANSDPPTGGRELNARIHPIVLLAHPAVVVAILVCGVNDHVLKGSGWLHGAITGKLSDIAGLFFFPILLAVILYIMARGVAGLLPPGRITSLIASRRICLDVAVVLTVVVFAAINLSESANTLAASYWGVFTMDWTDLFCLPMVLVARQFALKRWSSVTVKPKKGPPTDRLSIGPPHLAALLAASLVSLGTPAPPKTISTFPMWEITDPVIRCPEDVEIRSWFARSTKEGAGLVLRLENRKPGSREIAVDRARMLVADPSSPDEVAMTVEADPIDAVEFADAHSFYLPFAFDNQRAWNRDLRLATVILEVNIDGEIIELRYDAEQRPAPYYEQYETRYRTQQEEADGYPRRLPPGESHPSGGVDESQRLIVDEDGGYRIRFEQNARNACDGSGI